MPLDSTTYETPVMNLLRRARTLLSRRRAWAQGGLAFDKQGGDSLNATDSDAAAFCMLGALQHEVGGDVYKAGKTYDLYHEACRELAMTIRPGSMSSGGDPIEIIPDYNDDDHRQKRTVLRAFDRTIARIRALVTTA